MRTRPRSVATPTGETYTVHVTPAELDGGYIAEVLELPGCVTQGDTIPETLANITDALRVFLAAEGRQVTVSAIEPGELATTRVFDVPVWVAS